VLVVLRQKLLLKASSSLVSICIAARGRNDRDSRPGQGLLMVLGGRLATLRDRFYAFFIPRHVLSSPFLRTKSETSSIVLTWRWIMDLVFIAGGAALWFVMVLLVWGFARLEKPQGERS
jgi:hypothetical protein